MRVFAYGMRVQGTGHACTGLQEVVDMHVRGCRIHTGVLKSAVDFSQIERERGRERETERGAAWPILSIVVLAVVKVNDLSTTTLSSLHCGHVNPPIHLGRDRVDPYSQCQEG